MARGGTSTGNCNKAEKFLQGLMSHSCFNIIVVICCMCTSLFMVQLILTRALGNCNNTATLDSLTSSVTELSQQQQQQQQQPSSKTPETSTSTSTQKLLETKTYDATLGLGQETSSANVSRIVFGIAGAAKNWPNRKQYVKLWWNSHKIRLRGFVWLDKEVEGKLWDTDAPPFRVSEDTKGFEYKHRGGNRAAIRISRVVKELVRLGLPDVDWFVMGDEDTFFFPQNVADVLSKYDPSKMFYVGMPSESHSQNLLYSYGMAFGGGGFAISSVAAKAISAMLDPCIARYPELYGSDARIHACMSELGVALTKEPGFHQMDINGDAMGVLAAHPVAPLMSIHHLDVIKPIFPNMPTQIAALAHLLKAGHLEQASLLQQSICYYHHHHNNNNDNNTNNISTANHHQQSTTWSFSVSWGYAIQVYNKFLSPLVLETPIRTFKSCHHSPAAIEFPFNTRELPKDVCEWPTMFFLESAAKGPNSRSGLLETVYLKQESRSSKNKQDDCKQKMQPLITSVTRIRVWKEPVSRSWFKAPRRDCCRVDKWTTDTIEMHVGPCSEDSIGMVESQNIR